MFLWLTNLQYTKQTKYPEGCVFLLSGVSAESKKNITLCALRASSEAGGKIKYKG
jgi:hypothetical protein